jgi:Tfp pilus assembly protein PilX
MHILHENKEKGVALVIVFFVMVVVVAVVLSTATYLYSDIKVIRDMSNSVVSFYAADSGVEKVLYYDRKDLQGVSPSQVRGVCSMCAHLVNSGFASSCDSASDPSLACACSSEAVYDSSFNNNGCNPTVCNNCVIKFTTTFDNETYTITATVYPNHSPYDMEIDSSGAYGGVGRALDITLPWNSNNQ